jgi:hypothetical protein
LVVNSSDDITVINIKNFSETDVVIQAIMKGLAQQFFNLPAQKEKLKQAFANINLATDLANDGLDYLRPTIANYCFKENSQVAAANFLAILSLTGNI